MEHMHRHTCTHTDTLTRNTNTNTHYKTCCELENKNSWYLTEHKRFHSKQKCVNYTSLEGEKTSHSHTLSNTIFLSLDKLFQVWIWHCYTLVFIEKQTKDSVGKTQLLVKLVLYREKWSNCSK